MRYLTYDEYIDIGGTLEETAFKRVIDKACGIVDLYTQKRLRSVIELSDRDKACVRDLCEYVSANSANGTYGGAILSSKSQSAGGVSESESYTSKSSDEIDNEIYEIVHSYLASECTDDGVPLMYKGVEGGGNGMVVTKYLTAEFDVKYGKNSIKIPLVTYRD